MRVKTEPRFVEIPDKNGSVKIKQDGIKITVYFSKDEDLVTFCERTEEARKKAIRSKIKRGVDSFTGERELFVMAEFSDEEGNALFHGAIHSMFQA